MSDKKLAGMLLILVLLIALFALQKSTGYRPPAASEDKRICVGWNSDNIRKFEIYKGTQTAESIIVERDGLYWKLPKTFNSKGDKGKIESFLTSLSDLKGLPRGTGQAIFKDLGVEPDKAIHIVIYGNENREIEHVLVGKRGPGYDKSFVKRFASDQVFLANRNLLTSVGAKDDDDKPLITTWLDLEMITIDKTKISSFVFETPFSAHSFKRIQKKKEKPEDKDEFEWTNANASIPFKLKPNAVDGILDSIKTLKGEDVADPAKIAEYGFDSALYKAAFTIDGQKTTELLVGKELASKKDSFYAKVDRGREIFVISKSTVDSIFKKGKDLLDFPSPEIPGYFLKLVITGRHREFVVSIKGERLVITEPKIDIAVDHEKAKDFIRNLAKFDPDDISLLQDRSKTGLDMPEHKVVLEGTTGILELRIGSKVLADPTKRFFQFSGSAFIYIISETDLSKFVPHLDNFVDYKPIKVQKEAITAIKTKVEGKDVTLEQGEEWYCKYMGYPFAGISSGINKCIDILTDFKPKEILNKLTVGSAEHTIVYNLEDGSEITVEIGKTLDWHWAKIKDVVYEIDEQTYKKPQQKLDELHEKIIFKKRDSIESFTLKTETGDKVLVKDKIGELKIEEILLPDKIAESGVKESKVALVIKVRSGTELVDKVIKFGNQPVNKTFLRHAFLEGSDTVVLIKEDFYQSLLK